VRRRKLLLGLLLVAVLASAAGLHRIIKPVPA
jgi:hypothetical protein